MRECMGKAKVTASAGCPAATAHGSRGARRVRFTRHPRQLPHTPGEVQLGFVPHVGHRGRAGDLESEE